MNYREAVMPKDPPEPFDAVSFCKYCGEEDCECDDYCDVCGELVEECICDDEDEWDDPPTCNECYSLISRCRCYSRHNLDFEMEDYADEFE